MIKLDRSGHYPPFLIREVCSGGDHLNSLLVVLSHNLWIQELVPLF